MRTVGCLREGIPSSMLDLGALTEACYDLEPLPASATRLIRLAADADADVDEIITIVTYDPALTARLLRVANSVEAGGVRPSATVRAAVLRLGIGLVLGIALGSSVRIHLSAASHEYYLQEGELWRHSVAAAIAGHLARSVASVELPLESFTAALLHDIGKLALLRHMTPEVFHVLQRAREQTGFSQLEAESEILGIHHGELGGLIARHWRLPERIVLGITHHHDPDACEQTEDSTICFVVHTADLVAKLAGAGVGEDQAAGIDEPTAATERLGMTSEGFVQLCERVKENLDAVLRWYA